MPASRRARPSEAATVTERKRSWRAFVQTDSRAAAVACRDSPRLRELAGCISVSLPAIGGALAGFLALLLGTGWMVRTFTPARHTTGPKLTVPPDSWIIGAQTGHGVPYHPASQYWPLQLAFLAILLALAAALLASGWHATRTRAV